MKQAQQKHENLRLMVKQGVKNDKDSTYKRIGSILLQIQNFENILRFIMTFVIQRNRDKKPGYKDFYDQSKLEREKTIGYFLSQLRYRAIISPYFDKVFARFIDNRNIFIHHLQKIPGFDIDSSDGLEKINDFLTELATDWAFLSLWMTGIINLWEEQNGTNLFNFGDSIFIDEDLIDISKKSLFQKDP